MESEEPSSPLRRSWRTLPTESTDDLGGNIPSHEKKGELKLLWEMMKEYLSNDKQTIQKNIVNHIEYTLARSRFTFTDACLYQATALSVRDRLIEFWNDTQTFYTAKKVKRVYYLSIEYLLGRLLQNSLINLDVEGPYREALGEIGYKLEDILEQESDPPLGSGGLGRLAACFLDSLASLELPAWGYGIRYRYGMFKQGIRNGYQTESPNFWLSGGNPWEIERTDVKYNVRFGGYVVKESNTDSLEEVPRWKGGEEVVAVPFDMPIPGYGTPNVNNLRMWNSKPSLENEFDLDLFNQGVYYEALVTKQMSENITSILYPADNTKGGKELRLKQQYFFCSATLQDIFRRFLKLKLPFSEMPKHIAIQLNDTHPAIAIPEFIRLLVDVHGVKMKSAIEIIHNVFFYTNHTILPEALELWPVSFMSRLLPRHMQIIFDVNWTFLNQIREKYSDQVEKLSRLSLIQEGDEKMVRMASLSILFARAVNGVATLHTDILKQRLFRDWYELYPEKFVNRTNGVTPRRWLRVANPFLSDVFDKWLETKKWMKNYDMLRDLEQFIDNEDFQNDWWRAKMNCKVRLANYILRKQGIKISTSALFDVHIKRIHEYKRQLMNILSIIHRYLEIKQIPRAERYMKITPRVCILAGKAAPSYQTAKLIIKLINSVADVINNDSDVADLLKVVFIPDYSVSLAEIIIPASDISQHISTAGTEASGTSNMKFAMNGGLLLGTMDGANVEIAEEIDSSNMFIFGLLADQVDEVRRATSEGNYQMISPRMKMVMDTLELGIFASQAIVSPILNLLKQENDFYCLHSDFESYLTAQGLIDKKFRKRKEWIKHSILSSTRMGKFSSDRTIREYAKSWGIKRTRMKVLEELPLL